ncbi:MAG: serine hydroxymethyltransferase, partial [Clostridia bacterium]|nr:serine hydroxymethyltransferase [Clostridia bacterium]
GPRGGMILCKEQYAKLIDKAVFPGIQGGPLMHIIAAKAAAFGEALKPEFKEYQTQIVKNAKAMSDKFNELGIKLVSGGTDNHLMLLDLTDTGVSGKELETMLDEVNITLNKNSIPFDTTPASVTSGVRIGTPSVTTRGFKEEDCALVAELIAKIIREKESAFDYVRAETKKLTEKYPLYAGVIK